MLDAERRRKRSGRALLILAGIGAGAVLADGLAVRYGGGRKRPPASQAAVFRPRRAAEQFRHKTDHRVLVVGWDGGTFEMIDGLLKQERLPNVRRLIDRGMTAALKSTVIPISTEAWAAAVTGRGPGKSGVVGFFRELPNSYDIELIDQTRMTGPPLWRIFSAHGMPSTTWAIPITFPLESVDGVMVGGMLAPLDSAYAYPPGMLKRLRDQKYLPDVGKWREQRELTLDLIEEQLRVMRDMLVSCMKQPDWKLTLVNFKSLDVLSHRKYIGKTSGDVADLYCKLDAALGDLVEAAGPQTDIILMSDHGFAPYFRSFSTNRFLADHGYLVRKPGAKLPPEETRGDRKTSTRHFITVEAERQNEHRDEIDAIEMSKTVAFGGVTEGNYGTIRVNLIGREPHGIVKPEDVNALCDRIERDLLSVVDPLTKRKAIKHVYRTAKLYPGPKLPELSEIMFDADDPLFVKPEYRAAEFRRLPFMIPSHNDRGVFIAAGPSINPSSERKAGSILDVAPMVLQMVGLPAYAEMDGRVPAAWLKDQRVLPPIAEKDDAALQAWSVRFGENFTAEQRKNGAEDVKGIGYLNSP